MAQAHDEAIGLGGDFQFAGQGLFLDDEGMVACGHEVLWKFAKNGLAIVMDTAGLAVHQGRGAHYFATECVTNGLMAKTNSQDW